MIHLYCMTWDILSSKFYTRHGQVFFWWVNKNIHLCILFRKQGITMRAGRVSGGCVLCDSQWSLNHLMLAPDFLLPALTEIIVVFIPTRSQSQLMWCSRPGYCDYACPITPANVGTETEKIVSGLLKYRNVLTGKSQESLLWYKWKMLMPISLFFSINFNEMIDWSAW